jgi:hypothetical protein
MPQIICSLHRLGYVNLTGDLTNIIKMPYADEVKYALGISLHMPFGFLIELTRFPSSSMAFRANCCLVS